MAAILLVSGTWTRERDAWYRPGSAFVTALESRGHHRADPTDGTWYGWSRALDGVIGRSRAWEDAARALRFYLLTARVDAVVAHSHGGSLMALAAELGAEVPRVILCGAPIRPDLTRAYRSLRAATRHLASVWTPGDPWAWLGSMSLRHPCPTRARAVPRAVGVQVDTGASWRGRHRALMDPAVWTRAGLWGLLGAPAPSPS